MSTLTVWYVGRDFLLRCCHQERGSSSRDSRVKGSRTASAELKNNTLFPGASRSHRLGPLVLARRLLILKPMVGRTAGLTVSFNESGKARALFAGRFERSKACLCHVEGIR